MNLSFPFALISFTICWKWRFRCVRIASNGSWVTFGKLYFPEFRIYVWTSTVRQVMVIIETKFLNSQCRHLPSDPIFCVPNCFRRCRYWCWPPQVANVLVQREPMSDCPISMAFDSVVPNSSRMLPTFRCCRFLLSKMFTNNMSISLSFTQTNTSVNGAVMKTIYFNCTNRARGHYTKSNRCLNALLWVMGMAMKNRKLFFFVHSFRSSFNCRNCFEEFYIRNIRSTPEATINTCVNLHANEPQSYFPLLSIWISSWNSFNFLRNYNLKNPTRRTYERLQVVIFG